MEILGKTSLQDYDAVWFRYNNLEYGINENFDPDTLMCDGSNCDNINDSSNAWIATLIKAKVEKFGGVRMVPWI